MLLTNVSKTWAMPNGKTFKIKPIEDLIGRYRSIIGEPYIDNPPEKKLLVLDPFANEASIRTLFLDDRFKYISNDLDPQYDTDYHMDALDFMKKFPDSCASLVLFDSPYSMRQVSECYKKLGRTVTATDTSNKTFGDFKKEIARITKIGGYVLSFMWNSNGIGNSLGFEQKEILLVAHGSMHNDTICTVEQKIK